jgi:hypothetical protein
MVSESQSYADAVRMAEADVATADEADQLAMPRP